MKCSIFASSVVLAILLAITATTASAQTKPRTAGIGIHGSYWDINDGPMLVTISEDYHRTVVSTGGGGGWINFFSRTSDYWFLDFSLGAVARTVDVAEHFDGEDTHVVTIVPALLGMRYQLVSPWSTSGLRPYMGFGAGPYWIADIWVHDYGYSEDATIKSELKMGGYLCGGLDFMLTDWFGLNFDVKYHFVDFNVKSPDSGYEYALGVQVMWGSYTPQRHHERSGRRW